MIDVGTGIAKALKKEGIDWVSTFPVCRVNNYLGKENIPMIMMRDDRYAIALADSFSRVTSGNNIGVCIFAISLNAEEKVKKDLSKKIKNKIKFYSISPDSQYSLPIFSVF